MKSNPKTKQYISICILTKIKVNKDLKYCVFSYLCIWKLSWFSSGFIQGLQFSLVIFVV